MRVSTALLQGYRMDPMSSECDEPTTTGTIRNPHTVPETLKSSNIPHFRFCSLCLYLNPTDREAVVSLDFVGFVGRLLLGNFC
jgi:hypothetical protein